MIQYYESKLHFSLFGYITRTIKKKDKEELNLETKRKMSQNSSYQKKTNYWLLQFKGSKVICTGTKNFGHRQRITNEKKNPNTHQMGRWKNDDDDDDDKRKNEFGE